MEFFSADTIYAHTHYDLLADRIGAYLSKGTTTPDRIHLDYPNPGHEDSTLLLMPSWRTGAYLGVKVVTISPENGRYDLPSIYGQYLLFDAQKGRPLGLFDGKALTNVRTAAASLLAARKLARPDAASYLIAGTGALASHFARAYSEAFSLQELLIWGRDRAKAVTLQEQWQDLPCPVRVVDDLTEAQSRADIVSALTLSPDALLFGASARAGQHYDLVGAYKPDRREVDGALMARGSVYVDTHFGGLHEAGDIVLAIQEGAIQKDGLLDDLTGLYQSPASRRQSEQEITIFKSVGHAAEDLAAAVLLYENFLEK